MSADDSETLFVLRAPKDVAQTLFRFATNPVGFVGSIISAYIINAVLNLGGFTVSTVLAMFDIVAGAFDWVRITLITAFGTLGIDILSAYMTIQQGIADVVASAGPAGPFLATGVAAVLIYLGYRVSVALLGEVPIGSSIVDLLGLR